MSESTEQGQDCQAILHKYRDDVVWLAYLRRGAELRLQRIGLQRSRMQTAVQRALIEDQKTPA